MIAVTYPTYTEQTEEFEKAMEKGQVLADIANLLKDKEKKADLATHAWSTTVDIILSAVNQIGEFLMDEDTKHPVERGIHDNWEDAYGALYGCLQQFGFEILLVIAKASTLLDETGSYTVYSDFEDAKKAKAEAEAPSKKAEDSIEELMKKLLGKLDEVIKE